MIRDDQRCLTAFRCSWTMLRTYLPVSSAASFIQHDYLSALPTSSHLEEPIRLTTMKRSASSTPPSSPLVTPKSEHHTHGNDEDYTPATELNENRTPSKKPRASFGTSPKKTEIQSKSFKLDRGSVSASASDSVGHGGWESGWTPDKKEAIVERLMSLGIKCANMSELSKEVWSEQCSQIPVRPFFDRSLLSFE